MAVFGSMFLNKNIKYQRKMPGVHVDRIRCAGYVDVLSPEKQLVLVCVGDDLEIEFENDAKQRQLPASQCSLMGIENVERLDTFCFPCKETDTQAVVLSETASAASTLWIDPANIEESGPAPRPRNAIPSRFPLDLQERINALRNIYVDHLLTQQDLYKQVRRQEGQLNRNVHKRMDAKEHALISGQLNPTGGAAPVDHDHFTKRWISNAIGIPHFWLTVLQNINTVTRLVQSWDIPVLCYLVDVRQSDVFVDLDPVGFKLHFEFSDNPYFSNTILSTTFHLKQNYSTTRDLIDAPTAGLKVDRIVGMEINWKGMSSVGILREPEPYVKPRCRTIALMTNRPTEYHKKASFFDFFKKNVENESTKETSIRTKLNGARDDKFNDVPSRTTVGLYFKNYVLPEKTAIYKNSPKSGTKQN